MCGVACLSKVLSHLQFGLNNLRVIDLNLLHNSHMSLTVIGISLLLEGLSEPSVKYKCSAKIVGL